MSTSENAHDARMSGCARGSRRTSTVLAALAAGLLLTTTACSVVDPAPISQSVPATGAAGEQSVATGDTTFLAECTSDSRIRRPTSYVLACADGGEILENLTWTDWGLPQASALGTLVYNDCSPTCASGKDVEVAARVVADNLVAGDGIATYRRLTVTSTGPFGSGQATQQVYHLPGDEPDAGAALSSR